ncbi:MAG: aminoacyl-tRNA hydrolase, partial [Nitrospinales bacterium]
MYLIFGLGNPGPRYETTRHNTGFLVVDTLTEKHSIRLDKHKYRCVYGDGKIDKVDVRVAKPLTYMNESGKAVRAVQTAFQVRPEQIIVVYDEIDFPLGKIKVKHSGGDAGNLGIRSIIESLQTDRFTRVRVGIGRPQDRDQIVDYVL